MSKTWRIVLAVLWSVLAAAAGLLILVIVGLHDAFGGGGPLFTPQFIALVGLLAVLVVSAVGETVAARGEDTSTKQSLAKIFAFLPLGLLALVAMLILIR